MNKLLNTTSMAFSKKTFAVAGLAAAIALAGCSSDNPDAGSSSATTEIQGIVVDGYIYEATVYVDVNNNGRKNAGEPWALTDKDGYFSKAKDGTDYCSDNATIFEKTYCLKIGRLKDGENVVIRTVGGFDLFTGEPFEGSLSARVEVGSNRVIGDKMVSPLTSALVDVSDELDQQSVLDALGLNPEALEADFLDEIAGYDAGTVNTVTKLHKVVTILSKQISDQFPEIGEERSFPETPNAIVYKALADSIRDEGSFNSAAISPAFTTAQTAIQALYDADNEFAFPGTVIGTNAISNASDMLGLIDSAIPVSTGFSNVKARLIGIETVVKQMLENESANFTNAIAVAGNPSSDLYTTIENAFGVENGDVDFLALKGIDFSSPDYADVAFEGGASFANLLGKQLYASFVDGNKSGSGYFFFNGEQGENAGELKFCMKYDDGEAEKNFLETSGVLFSGTWHTINDSRLVLNLASFLKLSMSDKGKKNDKYLYSITFDGETRSWLSDDGLLDELESQSVVEQPTNDDSCKTLLTPSS